MSSRDRPPSSNPPPARPLVYVPTAAYLTPRPAPAGPARDLIDFAIRLFEDPSRIFVKGSIRIGGRFVIPAHAHPRWLQFVLVSGCTGFFTRDHQQIPVRGTTAIVFYPGEAHMHDLAPIGPAPGEEFSIKLKVDPAWAVVSGRLFQPVAYNVRGELMLVRALRRLVRLSAVGGDPGPILVARLVEALCLWPSSVARTIVPDRTATTDSDLDKPMRAALALMDQRLREPPSVDELASVADLSARHFARRFRQMLGVTPREYLDARRLTRAKELLLEADVTVADVGDQLGFGSPAAFSRWFDRQTGVPPSRYRSAPTRDA